MNGNERSQWWNVGTRKKNVKKKIKTSTLENFVITNNFKQKLKIGSEEVKLTHSSGVLKHVECRILVTVYSFRLHPECACTWTCPLPPAWWPNENRHRTFLYIGCMKPSFIMTKLGPAGSPYNLSRNTLCQKSTDMTARTTGPPHRSTLHRTASGRIDLIQTQLALNMPPVSNKMKSSELTDR